MDKMGNLSSPKKDQTSFVENSSQPSNELQQMPNLEFHKGNFKYVREPLQWHIQNWEKYSKESQQERNLYRDLESDHSFIQWIFPNFFKSMFNYDSFRLTPVERDYMIQDENVMKQYISNFQMFLRFLGIKLIEDSFDMIDEKQFNICLFENPHNQMRLQRVFASLSVLKQRNTALKLLSFLKAYLQKIKKAYLYEQIFKNYEQVEEESEDLSDHEKVHQYHQNQLLIETPNKLQQFHQQSNNIQGDISDKNEQEKFTQNIINNSEIDTCQQLKQKELEKQGKVKESQSCIIRKTDITQLPTFAERKRFYVQSDLINEQWITDKLLTSELLLEKQ